MATRGALKRYVATIGISDDVDVPLYVMPGQVDLISDGKALTEEFRLQLGRTRPGCRRPRHAQSQSVRVREQRQGHDLVRQGR